jgi:hypothetical protein
MKIIITLELQGPSANVMVLDYDTQCDLARLCANIVNEDLRFDRTKAAVTGWTVDSVDEGIES